MTTHPWADSGDSRTAQSPSADTTEALGQDLGHVLPPDAVVSLTGPLGCGKTVLTRGIARSLGVQDVITSPTFVIVAEYGGHVPFYHMDLYRLTSTEDLENLGFLDIVSSPGVCVIEWGERAAELLPRDSIHVVMEILRSSERRITVSGLP